MKTDTPHSLSREQIEDLGRWLDGYLSVTDRGAAQYEAAVEYIAHKVLSETRDKFIRCVWVVEREFGYGKAMRVVRSDHPRFSVGTRFDFGFLNIAIEEGYRIQIDPVPPHVLHDMEEARREREQDPR